MLIFTSKTTFFPRERLRIKNYKIVLQKSQNSIREGA